MDLLTDNFNQLWRQGVWGDLDFECDCPAKEDIATMHAEWCGVRPIYAELIHELGGFGPYNIVRDIVDANMSMTQTVIECAKCGRENLGKNMVVIYEAPLYSSAGGSHLYDYKYPCNIVKAICPHHNRAGLVAYQAPAVSGYGA